MNNTTSQVHWSKIIAEIKPEYLSLFPPKCGLSEFYVWSDDFNTRQRINNRFSEIHKEIMILLENKSC